MASPIPTQLSPGVKVSEIDLSTFVQPEAANSAGMAGVFNWGPGLVATKVTSESDLANIFGKPTRDQSDTTNNQDFLAASNFLKYSSNLKVVREIQSGDYNSTSTDVGITWINSVDRKTIKNMDEFRNFGGFSGAAGIESKAYFKARYPGNFGDSLKVVVYDGITGEEFTVTTIGYEDFNLLGGYNPVIQGISYGGLTANITAYADFFVDTDGDGFDDSFAELSVTQFAPNTGSTLVNANWYIITFQPPTGYTPEVFIARANETNGAGSAQRNNLFSIIYASGTTTENYALTDNGTNPAGNYVNYNDAAIHNDDPQYGNRSFNLFAEFGGNQSLFMKPSSVNPNFVDLLVLEADTYSFLTAWNVGGTYDFGGAVGEKTITRLVPTYSAVLGLPANFAGSCVLSAAPNLSAAVFGGPFMEWKATYSRAPVNTIFGYDVANGKGWANIFGGGVTGPQTLKVREGAGATYIANFDSTGGLTGMRRNFQFGIVQFGYDVGTVTTSDYESYTEYRLFDKMPGTSEYASERGGANDEISFAVVDNAGKFGPRESVLERFELLSKAVDAKNLDNESVYYKDYINNNSQYVYLTKAFEYENGVTLTSTATTVFGDIVSDKLGADGVTYTRTGYYDSQLAYGESTATAPTTAEKLAAYSVFADDDSAVDILFIPESSVENDNSVSNSDLEGLVYDTVIEPRKDTVFVIPTPKPASMTQISSVAASKAINYRNNQLNVPNNSYTVVVAGRKLFFDTFNNQIRKMSLASDVAGIMSAQEIPWESPAGFDRGMLKNVIRLENPYTKADRDDLYSNQINFFNQFSDGSGTVLFGDKTMLKKPSAFDRINVRRVFIAAEKAIAKAAKYSLFEFNDEFTRSQFRNLVIPFLRTLRSQRGIADFKVVCDETNNTPQVIDNNQFVADIYIKPAKSINFIQLNFVAVKGDFNLTVVE